LDAHAALRERQRDAPRPDAKLQGVAVASELGEKVGGRSDNRRVSPVTERRVLALGDAAREVVLGHRYPDRFSFPCRFACRSPTPKIQSPSGIATTPITISGQMSPQTAPTS